MGSQSDRITLLLRGVFKPVQRAVHLMLTKQGGFLMKGKYLRKFGSIILAALLLPAAATLLSSTSAQAQRRVVIVRTYRPFYRPWGWGYRRWDYDPYFDYYSRYGHYVFKSS